MTELQCSVVIRALCNIINAKKRATYVALRQAGKPRQIIQSATTELSVTGEISVLRASENESDSRKVQKHYCFQYFASVGYPSHKYPNPDLLMCDCT